MVVVVEEFVVVASAVVVEADVVAAAVVVADDVVAAVEFVAVAGEPQQSWVVRLPC